MAKPKEIDAPAPALTVVPSTVDTPAPDREPVFVHVEGRGNIGKSTLIRWMAERALLANRSPVIADCDRKNQTLTAFWPEGVDRPDHADDDSVVSRLNQIVDGQAEASQEAIAKRDLSKAHSVVLDMGGGDLVFPRYAASMDLASLLVGAGIRPVSLIPFGPNIDDLVTLNEALNSRAFWPGRVALILNGGLIRATSSVDAAFHDIRNDRVFKAAVKEGAQVIVMPRLACMAELDNQRMFFSSAEQGLTTGTQKKPTLTARQMVRAWLRQMEAAFAPIEDWLP